MAVCTSEDAFNKLRRDYDDLVEELDYVNPDVVRVSEDKIAEKMMKDWGRLVDFLKG